tara:strand:- start:54 stop:641 length:588 start_codon:yes stop_codon:yes gene_type:complete
MTNYIIEDDIDFYKELNMSSCKNINDTCLITNEPLTNNSITLPCNHKFNYLPLYREICKQKNNYNSLEITKLKHYQIKCPYCRLIINNLLPYNSEVEGVSKTRYVNSPSKYSFYPNKCKYVFKSGKSKGRSCNKNCLHEYCTSHNKVKSKIETKNTELLCTAVLKSGKNIGKQCGCKIYESTLCKRHCNINNKNI